MTGRNVSAVLLAAALIAGSISIVPILPVVLILAGIFFVVLTFVGDKGLRISGPVGWFLVYIAVSMLYAGVIGVDLFDLRLYRREFKFFVPFGAFIVFSSLHYPRWVDRTVIRALLFIAAANAVLFVASPALAAGGWMEGLYADDGNIWDPYASFFIYLGPFFSHSGGGGWFAAAAIICLSISREESIAPKLRSRFKWSSALFYLLLVLTLSRAYILGSVAVLTALSLQRYLDRRLYIGLATAAVITIGGVGLPYLGGEITSTSIGSLDDPLSTPRYNIVARYVLWGKAIENFVESPLIGVGVTRFDDEPIVIATIPYEVAAVRDLDARPEYFRAPLVRVNVGGAQAHTDQQAHNMYLHVLAEGGLLMFALMAMAIWSLVKWSKGVQRTNQGFRGGAARGVCWAVYVVLVASLFGNSFFTVTPMFFVLTLAGYLNGVVRDEASVPL